MRGEFKAMNDATKAEIGMIKDGQVAAKEREVARATEGGERHNDNLYVLEKMTQMMGGGGMMICNGGGGPGGANGDDDELEKARQKEEVLQAQQQKLE